MVLRFIEFAITILLGAFVITKIIVPFVLRMLPKPRGAERDAERARRRREDAENRLHAAIEDERASELLAAAERLRPPSGRGDLGLNMRWVEEHRAEYPDQWVALKDGEMVGMALSRRALQESLEGRTDLREILIVHMDVVQTTDEKVPEVGEERRKA